MHTRGLCKLAVQSNLYHFSKERGLAKFTQGGHVDNFADVVNSKNLQNIQVIFYENMTTNFDLPT